MTRSPDTRRREVPAPRCPSGVRQPHPAPPAHRRPVPGAEHRQRPRLELAGPVANRGGRRRGIPTKSQRSVRRLLARGRSPYRDHGVRVVPRRADAIDAADSTRAFEWLPIIESGINDVVFAGIAVYFLRSIPHRQQRRRTLAQLYRLRSLAHVIDMHQLTKDPERTMTRLPATDRRCRSTSSATSSGSTCRTAVSCWRWSARRRRCTPKRPTIRSCSTRSPRSKPSPWASPGRSGRRSRCSTPAVQRAASRCWKDVRTLRRRHGPVLPVIDPHPHGSDDVATPGALEHTPAPTAPRPGRGAGSGSTVRT